jgi:oligoribonuclease (3'-5' exoribonuclease)
MVRHNSRICNIQISNTILLCVPKLDKKSNNLKVQREKTQKAIIRETEQSKKLMGDDIPMDEIRGLYDEMNDDDLQAEKINKDTILHFLKKYIESYYE